MTMPTQKFFDQLMINLCEFLPASKRPGHFTDLFWRYWLIKRSCNLTGWEHFAPHLRNQIFQIGDLRRNTANNTNFHYIKKSVKINKIFQKIKETCFWPIFDPFSQFRGLKEFFWKIRPCHAKFRMDFYTMPKFRKN